MIPTTAGFVGVLTAWSGRSSSAARSLPVATLSKPDSSPLESATALPAAPDRGRTTQRPRATCAACAHRPPPPRHERSTQIPGRTTVRPRAV